MALSRPATPLSRLIRCLPLLAAGGFVFPGTLHAAGLSPDSIALLAGPCVNCHAPDGSNPASIPSLHGLSEARLHARLLAFHDGKASDATVMTRLMKGYDSEQIAALAKWFAAEARP